MYLNNAWYQACWSADLTSGTLLARTFLDRPIVMARSESGMPYALDDMCPHRFAPLSLGRIESGEITCSYHGLSFDTQGRCVHNPHGPVPKFAQVRAYPLLERHKAIWIWMGEPGQADEAKLPDLGFIDEGPESGLIIGYIPTAANYQLVADNIMDLSHADYLHPGSLGGIITGAKTDTAERDGGIVISWHSLDVAPPLAFAREVPEGSRADIWTEVFWRPPGVMVLQTGAVAAGGARDVDGEGRTLHSVTPETSTSCHYFYCATRRNVDPGFAARLKPILDMAFRGEDKPMLEAQQRRMGDRDFWSLKPILLGIDGGAVRTRRTLDRAIKDEVAGRIQNATTEPFHAPVTTV